MFRNGIFYYHRHDTGTGTKIVNGTCKVDLIKNSTPPLFT